MIICFNFFSLWIRSAKARSRSNVIVSANAEPSECHVSAKPNDRSASHEPRRGGRHWQHGWGERGEHGWGERGEHGWGERGEHHRGVPHQHDVRSGRQHEHPTAAAAAADGDLGAAGKHPHPESQHADSNEPTGAADVSAHGGADRQPIKSSDTASNDHAAQPIGDGVQSTVPTEPLFSASSRHSRVCLNTRNQSGGGDGSRRPEGAGVTAARQENHLERWVLYEINQTKIASFPMNLKLLKFGDIWPSQIPNVL